MLIKQSTYKKWCIQILYNLCFEDFKHYVYETVTKLLKF